MIYGKLLESEIWIGHDYLLAGGLPVSLGCWEGETPGLEFLFCEGEGLACGTADLLSGNTDRVGFAG